MAIARVFTSGNSQAIRLPKEFRVETRTLEIFRRGQEIVLRIPKTENISPAFELLRSLPDDFLPDRNQEAPQSRENL